MKQTTNLVPFRTLKEYKTIYVRSKNSNYELRSKIVLKDNVKEPALLITKVFQKNGEQFETTKLGRIPLSVLKELKSIIDHSIEYINWHLENNE